jgi:hypothetical protein
MAKTAKKRRIKKLKCGMLKREHSGIYTYEKPFRFCIGWIIGGLKYIKNTFKTCSTEAG